jgi:HEXXH motif-containing protein
MLFDVFSNPFEGDFLGLSEILACRQFLKTTARVNELGKTLEASPVEVDPQAVQPDLLSSACWRPETGFMRMGLNAGVTDRGDWTWLKAEASIAAFFSGAVESVSVDVESARPLTLAGHSVSGNFFHVQGEGDRIAVQDENGNAILLLNRHEPEGLPGIWLRDGFEENSLVRLGSAGGCSIATGDWLSYWDPDFEDDRFRGDTDEFQSQIQRAAGALEEFLPNYYVWTTALIREIVPIKTKEVFRGGTSSRSFMFCPGHIHFSVEATLIQTINMMIHECSHQFFHMALWNAPIVKKGAPEAYSVLKNTRRPLEKVLLGYHAFANIKLALGILHPLDNVIDPAELAEQEQHVSAIVANLDEPLQEHAEMYLEEAGKELYYPLRARLTEQERLSPVG